MIFCMEKKDTNQTMFLLCLKSPTSSPWPSEKQILSIGIKILWVNILLTLWTSFYHPVILACLFLEHTIVLPLQALQTYMPFAQVVLPPGILTFTSHLIHLLKCFSNVTISVMSSWASSSKLKSPSNPRLPPSLFYIFLFLN